MTTQTAPRNSMSASTSPGSCPCEPPARTEQRELQGDAIPSDVLPTILDQLDPPSTANLRLSCQSWKQRVDSAVPQLSPRCSTLEQLAAVLQLFPSVRSLSLLRLPAEVFASCARLCHLQRLLARLVAVLQQRHHLGSLTLSLHQAQCWGQLAWAHWVSHDSSLSASNSSSGSTAAAASSSSAEALATGPATKSSVRAGHGDLEVQADQGTLAADSSHPESGTSSTTGPSVTPGVLTSATGPADGDSSCGPPALSSSTMLTALAGSLRRSGSASSSCSSGSEGSRRVKRPLLPHWYAGSYAQRMGCDRHVVLYIPGILGAAGSKQLTITPPEAASSTSEPCSRSPAASTSSAAASRGGLVSSWSEMPCCLFLGSQLLRQLDTVEVYGARLLCLPPCLLRMRQLRRLVLEGCQLQLSADVFKCERLEELHLAHNGMDALPEGSWDQLKHLQVLDLSHNQLKDLPTSLSGAASLRHMLLSHNQLPGLPRLLCHLQQLQHLDASHNWLSGAQELAELLPSWPHLQKLHLRNVSSKRGTLVLPAQLAQCHVLEVLDVGDQYELCWNSLRVTAECPALQVLDITPLPKPQQPAAAAAGQALQHLARHKPWIRVSKQDGTLLQDSARLLRPLV